MRAALLMSAMLVIAAPAYAQPSQSQVQLRGAYSDVTVNVRRADDVGAAAVAGGNAVTKSGTGVPVNMVAVQRMEGDAGARASATIQGAADVAITSAAVANGATVMATDGNIDADITQFGHGAANAETNVNAGNVNSSGASSSASVNTTALAAENGDIRGNITQDSSGSVSATTNSAHRTVAGQAVAGAVASANNVSAAGSTTTMLMNVNQHSSGARVDANVSLSAARTSDAVGNATANANAASVDNAWGYLNATVRQDAASTVHAGSNVVIGGFEGFASSSAYGVGNSMTASNIASDTVLDVVQNNRGDTGADAALAANGNGDALASSAAYGNSISGGLCAYCDNGQPGLTANSSQTNSGDVHASARIDADRARTVAASASAIGNTATYQVSGPR